MPDSPDTQPDLETLSISNFHSAAQKAQIQHAAQAIVRGFPIDTQEAYRVLIEVVKHGLAEFEVLEPHLFAQNGSSRRMQAFHQALRQEYAQVRNILDSAPPGLVDRFEGPLLNDARPTWLQGKSKKSEIVVVFLTAFNNFYLSNLVLSLMLLEAGYSVLLLKSPRNSQFLNGIPGFGPDWARSARGLQGFLAEKGCDYRIMGFSSGGYAGLLATLSISAPVFVGFSVCSDLRPDSPLSPQLLFNEQVRGNTPPALHRNLAQEALTHKGYMRILVGALDGNDMQHAAALREAPGADVIIVPDEGHTIIRPLFLNGTLCTEMLHSPGAGYADRM